MVEDLLPGLVKVIEERLGPIGRPVTTFLVIVIVLAITAWGLNLFWEKAVEPVSTVVESTLESEGNPIDKEKFVSFLLGWAVYAVVLIGLLVFANNVLGPRLFRKQKEEVRQLIQKAEASVKYAEATKELADDAVHQVRQQLGSDTEGAPHEEA